MGFHDSYKPKRNINLGVYKVNMTQRPSAEWEMDSSWGGAQEEESGRNFAS